MKKILFLFFPLLVFAQPSGVQQIVAGANITLTPNSGRGIVTITASGGSGTPGGSDTQVQFNDGGAFGGVPGSSWNGSAFVIPNLTVSSLTATRIPFASTAGLLTDSSALTFNSGTATLAVTNITATTVTPTTISGATDNGQLFIGNVTSGNFEKAVPAGTANQITVTAGAGTLTFSIPTDPTIPGNLTVAGTGLSPFAGPLGIVSAASPTTSAAGNTAFDNNAHAASRGAIQVYDGTANTYVVAALASDTPTNGQVPTWNTGGTVTWETPEQHAGFSISGGGAALTTGIQDIVFVAKYGGTVTGWSITTSESDTITFDILRSAAGGAVPTVSIVGAGTKPTQASGISTVSTTTTSWTSTTITAGDNLRIQITGAPVAATASNFVLYWK